MIGGWGYEYFVAAQVDEEQAKSLSFPEWRPDGFTEKIARDKRIDVQQNELAPSGFHAGCFVFSFAWLGIDAVLFEDSSDGGFTDVLVKLIQLTNNATATPLFVLPGKTDNGTTKHCADFSGPTYFPRSSPLSLFAQPALIGLIGDDADKVFNSVSDLGTDQ